MIIGGGSIGLSTAYNLARSFSISSTVGSPQPRARSIRLYASAGRLGGDLSFDSEGPTSYIAPCARYQPRLHG